MRKFALANTVLIDCQENRIKGKKKMVLDTRLLKSAPGLLLVFFHVN